MRFKSFIFRTGAFTCLFILGPLKPFKEVYEGDAAITKLRKHGATEGWLVEVYPAKGCESERWFMKVQDGST